MILPLQKQSVRLRAMRLRRATIRRRPQSRHGSGEPASPLQDAQQRSCASAGSKRGRSDTAAAATESRLSGSSGGALDVASSPDSVAADGSRPRDRRYSEASSPAGVAIGAAGGDNSQSSALEPTELDHAGDDTARDVKAAALLQGQRVGSIRHHDMNTSARADSRGIAEQGTHADMPEPSVASALRDLTDQVQNLRTSAAAAQKAHTAVSCCVHEARSDGPVSIRPRLKPCPLSRT